MLIRYFSAAVCLLISGAVLAQSPNPVARRPVVGKAINVQGLVTVSDATGVSRVLVNNDVVDFSRYVTSSSGYATLRLDKGCDIQLKPNQALTIDNEKSCDELWAFIGSFGGTNITPFLVGGAVILLMGGGGGGATPAVIPPDGSGGQLPIFSPQ